MAIINIDNFTGNIVNPYGYKILNFESDIPFFSYTDSSILPFFEEMYYKIGYFEDLIFENCKFGSSFRLAEEANQIIGISFINCEIDLSNMNGENNIFINGDYYKNFRFEGKIVNANKYSNLLFYTRHGQSIPPVVENSSIIIDCGEYNVAIVDGGEYYDECYTVILGNGVFCFDFYDESIDCNSYYTNSEIYTIFPMTNPSNPTKRTVEEFLSGDASLFPYLPSYTFEEGKYPYIK